MGFRYQVHHLKDVTLSKITPSSLISSLIKDNNAYIKETAVERNEMSSVTHQNKHKRAYLFLSLVHSLMEVSVNMVYFHLKSTPLPLLWSLSSAISIGDFNLVGNSILQCIQALLF